MQLGELNLAGNNLERDFNPNNARKQGNSLGSPHGRDINKESFFSGAFLSASILESPEQL